MQFADRLKRLGTESAFEVSGQASEWEARGNEVFPFHLGDINIPMPQNIVDAMNRAIKDGKTGYCPPAGIPRLRAVLADDAGRRRGIVYQPENVSIQPGGKPVICKFILTLMNPGDEVLYPNPGYPIYESQIEFHGGVAVPYSYAPSGGIFKLDLDRISSKISPRTKLLVYNNCHNPTGAESSVEEMEGLAAMVLEHGLWVLSDEAYCDIRYTGGLRSIAAIPGMQERTVILYTFSKKYAMTGGRVGAAIGPGPVIKIISELNVNHESCTNHFMQWAMIEALMGPQEESRKIVSILKGRRDAACAMLKDIDGVTLSIPDTTFYLFPDVTAVPKRKGFRNVTDFQKASLENTGVAFCTRNHFGRPGPDETDIYVRFAYSGITKDRIQEGLSRLRAYFES